MSKAGGDKGWWKGAVIKGDQLGPVSEWLTVRLGPSLKRQQSDWSA